MTRTARARILVNPTAADRRVVERVLGRAATLGVSTADVVFPESAARLEDGARAAARDGVERVIVVGGDGTIHRVLEPLLGATGALGIVPCGTGNDLANALGLPADPVLALERALVGPTRRIDLGEVEGRPFAGTGGVGFDGEVARRVRAGNGRRLGRLAYAWCAVAALGSFDPPRVAVEFDGGRIEDRAMFVVLANSPMFGGGMRIAPHASLDDGLLDLVFVRRVGRFELLRTMPRVYSGTHVGHPRIATARTVSARLEVDRRTTVWGDGEPIVEVGPGPFEIRVRRAAIAVAA